MDVQIFLCHVVMDDQAMMIMTILNILCYLSAHFENFLDYLDSRTQMVN